MKGYEVASVLLLAPRARTGSSPKGRANGLWRTQLQTKLAVPNTRASYPRSDLVSWHGLWQVEMVRGGQVLQEPQRLYYSGATLVGWATGHLEKLTQGETVSFRPRGNSMTPIIKSGQLCTVAPIADRAISKGDVVLCKVRGNQFLHLVSAVKGDQVQISNNHGHVNGWCSRKNIFGVLVSVTP